jgi:hypothetical protein
VKSFNDQLLPTASNRSMSTTGYVYWLGLRLQSRILISLAHVNNVVYNRYAESARLNWINVCGSIDRPHRKRWADLMAPKGLGFILKMIKTDFKFVSNSGKSHSLSIG